jgi:hypothetical protein
LRPVRGTTTRPAQDTFRLIGAVRRHLVQTGLIGVEHGRFLNHACYLCQRADGAGDPLGIDDAA